MWYVEWTDVVSTRLPPCEEHVPVVFESPPAVPQQLGVVGGLQLVDQLVVAGLLAGPRVQQVVQQEWTVVSQASSL